jgi:peptidoglycan/LPS O-acetylase OafA/YrhL
VAYDLFVVVVGAPGLVLLAAAREPGPALTHLCQALGVMSYGLYALHVPTYELLRRMGLALPAWQVAATLAALAAAVLWLDHVYDQPIRASGAPLPRLGDAAPRGRHSGRLAPASPERCVLYQWTIHKDLSIAT